MSNSELKQSNQFEGQNLKNSQAQSNPKDSYEQLMEEGKQVLDSINLANFNDSTFIIHKQKDPTPGILSQKLYHNFKTDKVQQIQEEYRGQAMQDDSRKEPNQSLIQIIKKSSKIFGCNCLKSKCTKNYCQCFTQARKCNELCKCTGCQNQGEVQKRYRPNIEAQEGEKFCNCKKSNCLKKYCECYNSGAKCNSNCKCEQCKNAEDVVNGDIEEMKDETKKEKSQKEIIEIEAKLEQLSKLVPKEHQQYLLSFLDYLFA